MGHAVEQDRTATLAGYGTSGLAGYRTPSLDEEESYQEESYQEEDSNQLHLEKKSGDERKPLYSPWIGGVIVDYSRELGDTANAQANTTQALRIWQGSGLPEQRFVDLLYQAKATTREYQGKQGRATIANRMSYFFVVLRDLVARSEPPVTRLAASRK